MQGIAKKWGDQFNKSSAKMSGRNRIYPLGDKSGGPVVTKTAPLVKALADAEKADPGLLRLSERDANRCGRPYQGVFPAGEICRDRLCADPEVQGMTRRLFPV